MIPLGRRILRTPSGQAPGTRPVPTNEPEPRDDGESLLQVTLASEESLSREVLALRAKLKALEVSARAQPVSVTPNAQAKTVPGRAIARKDEEV